MSQEFPQAASAQQTGPFIAGSGRLPAIDILRGLAIIFMALDHARDFTSNISFEPEDLAHTFPALFLTRWVTHFSAPIFFFLAGTGAYLMLLRTGSIHVVSRFLWTRGLWLIVVEVTIAWFAWTFLFPGHLFGVLSSLGLSMILLAALIRIPIPWLAGISLLVICAHDLFDPIFPRSLGGLGWIWAFLHVRGVVVLPVINWRTYVLFPLIPLAFVMSAGFAFGPVLSRSSDERARITTTIGCAATALFLLLRGFNLYGNPAAALAASSPGPWHPQPSLAMSAVAFLDVEKYPTSLQFLLMTLGPALILLAVVDGLTLQGRVPPLLRPILVFGQVPFFFYVLHLYVIHLAAIGIFATLKAPVGWLFHGGFFAGQPPVGVGLSLPQVWVFWLLVVAALYFPCAGFARYKKMHHDWWLSYL